MAAISFQDQVNESVLVLQSLLAQTETVERITVLVRDALREGRTLFTCGNGGSAADALHLAEEMVCRYRCNRRPLAAVCLNADATALTCIANDFGYEQVFARQVAGMARAGDVLVCFSTSGNSPNILAALQTAHERGVISVALLGKDGGAARSLADHALVVESETTARIQEAHTLLLHAICEEIEQHLTDEAG
jgi:D-sedoheptulose 7-phosphate isomerase